jgi:hypothetical protein
VQARKADIEMERRLIDYSDNLLTIDELHKQARQALLAQRYDEAIHASDRIISEAYNLKMAILREKERGAN